MSCHSCKRRRRKCCTGPTGPRGDIGPTGPAGTNGTNGMNGMNGTNGTNGTDGSTGPTGPTGPAGLANEFWCLRETKPSGTDGGTAVVGWNTRELSVLMPSPSAGADVVLDVITHVITIQPGMYYIIGHSIALDLDSTKLALRDGAVLAVNGLSVDMQNNNSTQIALVQGFFTVFVPTGYLLQQFAQTGAVNTGLGVAVNEGTEIYSTIVITKLT